MNILKRIKKPFTITWMITYVYTKDGNDLYGSGLNIVQYLFPWDRFVKIEEAKYYILKKIGADSIIFTCISRVNNKEQ